MKDDPYLREKLQTKPLDTTLLRWLLRYLLPYVPLLAVGIFFLLIAKGIEVYVPMHLGEITQIVLDGGALETVTWGCFLLIGLLFFGYTFDGCTVVIKSWVSQRALYTLRNDVYRHLQGLPVRYYDRHAVGQMITRTIHDVDRINQMFGESVIPVIGSLFLFIGITVAIYFIDWRVGLAISAVMPLIYGVTNAFRRHQRACYQRIRAIVSAMNSFVQEYLMGANIIRNFGLQKQEREKFEQINDDECQTYIKTIRHFSRFFARIDFLQTLALVFVFIVLVKITPEGFQGGTYFTFSLYTLMLFRPLLDLTERYNMLQSAIAAAHRIYDLMQEVPEAVTWTGKEPLDKVKSIIFQDVWFAYNDENWVLKGICFSLTEKHSVALVGMTGAGKTSILSLLLGFYRHQKGKILINGKEIDQYSLESLRQHFSVVLQDPVIFSGTIADNIRFFDPTITDQQIDDVIKYANLQGLVARYPKGKRHRLKEQGRGLSVGEKQLLSLARATAHHKDILVLDEATASIDMATERMIQDAMEKVIKGRTALVIAHRLSTIRDVDTIIVLHDGKVVEQGTHEELLTQHGTYEKLYRLQFV